MPNAAPSTAEDTQSAEDTVAAEVTEATVAADAAGATSGPRPPDTLPVEELTAHPGNVRDDLELDAEFCASVAAAGVRYPLLVTRDGDGWRVIEGHRRLAAAIKAGHPRVPVVADPDRAGDEAGQYLDMFVANAGSHRRNFTPMQEALALFAAHEAGASQAKIRKATGRKAQEVKTALAAGKVSPATRERAAAMVELPTLDELALLAEFEGDSDALESLLTAMRYGHNVEYVAERLRQERAEAAEHARLRAEFEAAGYQVSEDLPDGAKVLGALVHDGQELTAEAHAQCPGRGVCFRPWKKLDPTHYCTGPEANGHELLFATRPFASGDDSSLDSPDAGGHPVPDAAPDPEPEPAPDPARALVIEGNKAWTAATEVRRRWLRELLARRSAPREVAPFVAAQLLTFPEPMRSALSRISSGTLFRELAGRDADVLAVECGGFAAGRLPLVMLAPIAVAYETEISGFDDGRRATWRPERYSPCPTDQAGRYLAFLASLGYELTPIEHAVASGTPYTGDNPAEPLAGEGSQGDDGDVGAEDEDRPPWAEEDAVADEAA